MLISTGKTITYIPLPATDNKNELPHCLDAEASLALVVFLVLVSVCVFWIFWEVVRED